MRFYMRIIDQQGNWLIFHHIPSSIHPRPLYIFSIKWDIIYHIYQLMLRYGFLLKQLPRLSIYSFGRIRLISVKYGFYLHHCVQDSHSYHFQRYIDCHQLNSNSHIYVDILQILYIYILVITAEWFKPMTTFDTLLWNSSTFFGGVRVVMFWETGYPRLDVVLPQV